MVSLSPGATSGVARMDAVQGQHVKPASATSSPAQRAGNGRPRARRAGCGVRLCSHPGHVHCHPMCAAPPDTGAGRSHSGEKCTATNKGVALAGSILGIGSTLVMVVILAATIGPVQ